MTTERKSYTWKGKTYYTEASLEIDTGAQSPLCFDLTDHDIRLEPWDDGGFRLRIRQDESDTFYGSNLTREQAQRLFTWLGNALIYWSE